MDTVTICGELISCMFLSWTTSMKERQLRSLQVPWFCVQNHRLQSSTHQVLGRFISCVAPLGSQVVWGGGGVLVIVPHLLFVRLSFPPESTNSSLHNAIQHSVHLANISWAATMRPGQWAELKSPVPHGLTRKRVPLSSALVSSEIMPDTHAHTHSHLMC